MVTSRRNYSATALIRVESRVYGTAGEQSIGVGNDDRPPLRPPDITRQDAKQVDEWPIGKRGSGSYRKSMNCGPTTVTDADHVSVAIVEAVAAAEGVDPVELTPPLYEVVDTDALDRLFAPNSQRALADGRSNFSYKGYTITVEAGGTVTIEE